MSSMAMSFFYSWQTYSFQDGKQLSSAEKEKMKPEVIDVGFREVLVQTGDNISSLVTDILNSNCCEQIKYFLDPLLIRLEVITGRGGNMTQGQYSQIAMS